MHESHWPSNLAWLLSLCTCIPNLDEIEQFLEQIEHGNQSATEGQTQINIPPFSSKRKRGTIKPCKCSSSLHLFSEKKILRKFFYFFFSLNFLFPWQLKPANVHQKPRLNETIRPKLCAKTKRVDTKFYVSTRQSKCLWWTVFSFNIMYVVSQVHTWLVELLYSHNL